MKESFKKVKSETEEEILLEKRRKEIEQEINKHGDKKNREKNKEGIANEQKKIDKLNAEKKQINLKRESILKDFKKSEYSPKKEKTPSTENQTEILNEKITEILYEKIKEYEKKIKGMKWFNIIEKNKSIEILKKLNLIYQEIIFTNKKSLSETEELSGIKEMDVLLKLIEKREHAKSSKLAKSEIENLEEKEKVEPNIEPVVTEAEPNNETVTEVESNIDEPKVEEKDLESIVKVEDIPEEKTENVVEKNVSEKKENWLKTKFASISKLFSKKEKVESLPEEIFTTETKEVIKSNEIEEQKEEENKEETTEDSKDDSVKFKTGDKVEFSDENFDTIKKVEEFEYIKPEEEKEVDDLIERELFSKSAETKKKSNLEEDSDLSMEDEEEEGWGMSDKAKGIFNKMSSGGKNLFSSIYKGINKIPVVDRMIAKTGIAYNQHFIDIKEGKSVELKDKMDELDTNLSDLSKAKSKIQIVMGDLEKHGENGYNSFLLEIKKIEESERKIANKRDKLQTRIEARENSIKLYVNKRDAIADGMINKYNEKLSPIEENLKNLETERDILGIYKLGKEAEIEEINSNIEFFIKQKEMVTESLLLRGISAENVSNHKSLRKFNSEIANRKNEISNIRADIEKRGDKINKKIEKTDKKANPYRDKRNEFIRVTDRKPIKIDLEERVNLVENTEREETKSHTRKNEDKEEPIKSEPKTSSTESSYSGYENNPKMSEMVAGLNKFIIDGKFDKSLLVDTEKIFKVVNKETRVTVKKFKEIVLAYYKFRKITENTSKKLIDNIK